MSITTVLYSIDVARKQTVEAAQVECNKPTGMRLLRCGLITYSEISCISEFTLNFKFLHYMY